VKLVIQICQNKNTEHLLINFDPAKKFQPIQWQEFKNLICSDTFASNLK